MKLCDRIRNERLPNARSTEQLQNITVLFIERYKRVLHENFAGHPPRFTREFTPLQNVGRIKTDHLLLRNGTDINAKGEEWCLLGCYAVWLL
jgi:hypothetical protein